MKSDLANTFRLAAMDIRGHGLSEKPANAYEDPRLWADDVHAVITELELDQPLLAGWSYGGAIISDYIAHYGENGIAGTNWIGAVCRLGQPLMELHSVGEEFAALTPGLFSEYVSESVIALQNLIDLSIPSRLSSEERYLLLGYNMAVPPHVRESLLSRNVDNDVVVRNIRKPMMLTWGDEDRVILHNMRDHIAALALHARISTYPGTGHAPFWEAPERFNAELREFRTAI